VDSTDSSTKPIVVKIGGSTLGNHDTSLEDLVTLQRRGMRPVVVHGGGNVISDWLGRFDIPVSFARGSRVTDARTLRVVIAVLAGLVNKELVASLEVLGGRAIGLTGVDGGLFEAEIKDAEMGYVGEVVKVDSGLLELLLKEGLIPVIAPLGLQSPPRTEQNGFVLNLNADTVAGEIAAALYAEKLVFLTDVAGICDSSGELLRQLSREEAKSLLDSGIATGGMIPKVEACLRAAPTVPINRIIDGRLAHALLKEVEGGGDGTTIS
jgi:acetylglutamate kinase